MRSYKIVVAICALAFITAAACFEFLSPDLYWHLRLGHDLIHEGLNPFVDHYSFTEAGSRVLMVPWLFEVLLAALVDIFHGAMGIVALRFLLWSCGLIFMFRLLGKITQRSIFFVFGIAMFVCAISRS